MKRSRSGEKTKKGKTSETSKKLKKFDHLAAAAWELEVNLKAMERGAPFVVASLIAAIAYLFFTQQANNARIAILISIPLFMALAGFYAFQKNKLRTLLDQYQEGVISAFGGEKNNDSGGKT